MALELIHDLSTAEIQALCAEQGWPDYRSRQLWQWLYRRRARAWEAMRNLPGDMRGWLEQRYALVPAEQTEIVGRPGATQKILARLHDGECVEAVVLPAGTRRTVCISCQVGCKFGCVFCASGLGGYRRDLSAGEMTGQVLLAAEVYGDKPTHVVFMGMGEPFDNYDAVLKCVRCLNDAEGLNIGARRITISTSGIVPGIRRLQGEGLQVELSVSLHAPDQALREKLMPVAKKCPLDELIPACRAYAETTGRIVTFEYTLIGGVNDSTEQARQLADLLSPLACRVNLIPLSPVPEYEGRASSGNRAHAFMDILKKDRINATIRDSQGSDLQAACGQLRRRNMQA